MYRLLSAIYTSLYRTSMSVKQWVLWTKESEANHLWDLKVLIPRQGHQHFCESLPNTELYEMAALFGYVPLPCIYPPEIAFLENNNSNMNSKTGTK